MRTYLVEMTVRNPNGVGNTFLRFSTSGYTTKGSDTPAHTHFEGRLIQPGLMRRDIYSDRTTGGASTVNYGVIELVNTGDLDYLLDYGFAGMPYTIKAGDDAAAFSAFTTVQTGTMEQAECGATSMTIRIKDRTAEFDVPVQTTVYGGTNSLPNGLDGTADDLKSRPKPLTYGKVFNISPPLVNTSRLIYQAHDGAVASVDAVYDQGVALTAGANYTSQADMEANAPAAGQYRVWPAGGCFRLNVNPSGTITADVTQGASVSDRTAAQILKTLALRAATLTAGDITTADVSALDAKNSAIVGIHIADTATIKSAMDEVAAAIGAWYGFDRLGKLRMGRLDDPRLVGATTWALDSSDVVTLERQASGDQGKGVPAWKIELHYAKNYTVLANLTINVPAAKKAWMAQEWRTALGLNATTQSVYPTSPTLAFDSLLTDSSAALAEAGRRSDLYSGRRDILAVKVRAASAQTAMNLGDTVTLAHPRYGCDLGKKFVIIGIQSDYRTGAIELTLWG